MPSVNATRLPDELFAAVKANDIERARALIDKSAELDIPSPDGNTPLLLASHHGLTDIARALIDKGAKLDLPDKNGNTPLHDAIRAANANIVNMLLAHGATLGKGGAQTIRECILRLNKTQLCSHFGILEKPVRSRYVKLDIPEATALDKQQAESEMRILFRPMAWNDPTPKFYYAIQDGRLDEILELAQKADYTISAKAWLMHHVHPVTRRADKSSPSVVELLTAQGQLPELFDREVWSLDNVADLPTVTAAIPPLYLEHQVGIKQLKHLLDRVYEEDLAKIEATHAQIMAQTQPSPSLPAPEQNPMPHALFSQVELKLAAEAYERECDTHHPHHDPFALDGDNTPQNPSRHYRERLEWENDQLKARIAELEGKAGEQADVSLRHAADQWAARIGRTSANVAARGKTS